jgi:hypothetical protein
MFTHGDINFPIIIFSLFFICSNGVVEYNGNCSQLGGIVLGFIIGIILGVLYYNLIISTGHPDIAYFNQVISDNTQCSKPGPTKFRCKKYVRGNRDSNGNYVPRELQFDTEISDDSIGGEGEEEVNEEVEEGEEEGEEEEEDEAAESEEESEEEEADDSDQRSGGQQQREGAGRRQRQGEGAGRRLGAAQELFNDANNTLSNFNGTKSDWNNLDFLTKINDINVAIDAAQTGNSPFIIDSMRNRVSELEDINDVIMEQPDGMRFTGAKAEELAEAEKVRPIQAQNALQEWTNATSEVERVSGKKPRRQSREQWAAKRQRAAQDLLDAAFNISDTFKGTRSDWNGLQFFNKIEDINDAINAANNAGTNTNSVNDMREQLKTLHQLNHFMGYVPNRVTTTTGNAVFTATDAQKKATVNEWNMYAADAF